MQQAIPRGPAGLFHKKTSPFIWEYDNMIPEFQSQGSGTSLPAGVCSAEKLDIIY